jgi:methionyl-tRNA synthetase
MENKKPFYVTTTIPYVNADPHIGFAFELVLADVIVRYKKLTGHDVFFNTGTDEHGLKIYRKAEEEAIDAQLYVDQYAEKFRELPQALNVSEYNFIRTTDAHHKLAAQEFWRRCRENKDAEGNSDIYLKEYTTKYCVGCELEKTDSELVDGRCPLHPNTEIEYIEEENYFFRFSRYQEKLLELYKQNPHLVVPASRFNEIQKFVEGGLKDFSISRVKEKMPWGVEVPDDTKHVMYVWFDALVNYISAIGWPDDLPKFEKYWPVVQIAGKDNLRQQSAMWQAMLMSAQIPIPSKQILIHGFVTSGGQKMSKSIGNVVNPIDIINEYGTDAVRYFLCREFNTFEDSDFTLERFKEAYNANLANGIGNLTSRIMKMATTHGIELSAEEKEMTAYGEENENLEKFEIQKMADEIWTDIKFLDKEVQTREPFKKIKTNPDEAKKDIHYLVYHLLGIALKLEPFLPETSQKIQDAIKQNKMPDPLFKRID